MTDPARSSVAIPENRSRASGSALDDAVPPPGDVHDEDRENSGEDKGAEPEPTVDVPDKDGGDRPS